MRYSSYIFDNTNFVVYVHFWKGYTVYQPKDKVHDQSCKALLLLLKSCRSACLAPRVMRPALGTGRERRSQRRRYSCSKNDDTMWRPPGVKSRGSVLGGKTSIACAL